MEAEFQKKEHEISTWLVLYWLDDEEADRDKLREELRVVGWDDDGMRGMPPIEDRHEDTLVHSGSALFAGQTKEEAKQFVAEARTVLGKWGIKAGRVRTRAWQEFL